MKYVWLISFFMLTLNCQAQFKDTQSWKAFELIAPKANSSTGAIKINMPLPYTGSLADVLNRYSALFIKSYSPGNLASTSMRGMGAQHTAVLWNGINLQSAMNSNIDLNLLPVFFFDQAAIETGANASSAANGAIAGAIYLGNDLKSINRIYGEWSVGSFGQRSLALGSSYTFGKVILNSRFLSRSAVNNFEFVNYFLPGKPTEKLSNSQFNQSGFMQEAQVQLSRKHQLYANYWYLQTDRNLPPAMGISSFNEHQDDYSHKFLLSLTSNLSNALEWNNKFSYVNEQINYFHDLLTPAFNDANTYFTESSLKWKVNQLLHVSTAISHTYQEAKTDGYNQGKHRNLLSLWMGLNYYSRNKRHKASLGTRQMMIDGTMSPASPDFATEVALHRLVRWKTNLAAGFRVPSFNDLYWQAGGNPDLKPEMSKKAESSMEFLLDNFKTSATVFLHHVNDWILWTPDPSSQVWKASNARSVESKGVELAGDFKAQLGNFHLFRVFGRYQFVQSTNVAVYSHDSSALGKQLFYTPYHTASMQFVYRYKAFDYTLGTNYTGSVFTTADNDLDNKLEPYWIWNTSISYNARWKTHLAELSFRAFNLFNQTYQVMQNRPMPLRNYQFAIQFNPNVIF